jgi:plasmid stabilization system protein ParE
MRPPVVEFHPEAITEARAARQWYANRSVSAADAFMAELDTAVERICTSPLICPVYLHGTRRYLFKRFPYLVVFREINERIQIIAVAHGRRRPGYWKRRVD